MGRGTRRGWMGRSVIQFAGIRGPLSWLIRDATSGCSTVLIVVLMTGCATAGIPDEARMNSFARPDEFSARPRTKSTFRPIGGPEVGDSNRSREPSRPVSIGISVPPTSSRARSLTWEAIVPVGWPLACTWHRADPTETRAVGGASARVRTAIERGAPGARDARDCRDIDSRPISSRSQQVSQNSTTTHRSPSRSRRATLPWPRSSAASSASAAIGSARWAASRSRAARSALP